MRIGDLDPPWIRLYWIPLGAGGDGFVRFNGRIYEALTAWQQRRSRLDLYHTALEVVTSDGRFTVENAWPSPDRHIERRGVVLEGPVFGRTVARFRWFRYEVRCWRDGEIPDVSFALGGGVVISEDARAAEDVLSLVASVPVLIWGRDELGVGEMWNSNSTVAYLLERCGLASKILPPSGGGAPGWTAGVEAARRGLGRVD